MTKKSQVVCAFVFGCTFVCALLVLALLIPNPTPFQYQTFRIVMALAAAGVAAMIPGFLKVEIHPTVKVIIRAGGALGVFVVVYFFNPAKLSGHSNAKESNPTQKMANSPGGLQAGRDINLINVTPNPSANDASNGLAFREKIESIRFSLDEQGATMSLPPVPEGAVATKFMFPWLLGNRMKVMIENGRLFCDLEFLPKYGMPSLKLERNVLSGRPDGWDFNQSPRSS